VDRGLEPGVRAGLLHVQGWRGLNNPWMAEYEAVPPAGDDDDVDNDDESDDDDHEQHEITSSGQQQQEEYLYINLLANPERYTGYQVCVDLARSALLDTCVGYDGRAPW
jgi:hypothetical protein